MAVYADVLFILFIANFAKKSFFL